jgi:transposase-like protein
VRKVSGQDRIRLLRCRTCGEECSERRGTALFNTKIAEEQAESIINPLAEGCGVRSTARLVRVAKDTVALLLRMAGRHAERFHDQRVRDVTPRKPRQNSLYEIGEISRPCGIGVSHYR